MKKIVFGIVIVLVAGGLGFSSLGGGAWLDSLGLRGEDRLVRSRVESFWQARVDQDLETQAKFAHPEQDGVFGGSMLVTDSYEIESVQIDGDQALAKVKVVAHLKHTILSRRVRELTLEDRWVRYDGTWCREPKAMSLGESIRVEQREGLPSPPGL